MSEAATSASTHRGAMSGHEGDSSAKDKSGTPSQRLGRGMRATKAPQTFDADANPAARSRQGYYPCKVCGLICTSAQQLGGHQNSHRFEQGRAVPTKSGKPAHRPAVSDRSTGPRRAHSAPRTRPANNQLLYRAQMRWEHYSFPLAANVHLPSATEPCASVTSAFLRVLSLLTAAEAGRAAGERNILRLLSQHVRRTKVVLVGSTDSAAAPVDASKHLLMDHDGAQYFTTLDRNRYGTDDCYLATVIRACLDVLGLCPALCEVDILDAKRSRVQRPEGAAGPCTCAPRPLAWGAGVRPVSAPQTHVTASGGSGLFDALVMAATGSADEGGMDSRAEHEVTQKPHGPSRLGQRVTRVFSGDDDAPDRARAQRAASEGWGNGNTSPHAIKTDPHADGEAGTSEGVPVQQRVGTSSFIGGEASGGESDAHGDLAEQVWELRRQLAEERAAREAVNAALKRTEEELRESRSAYEHVRSLIAQASNLQLAMQQRLVASAMNPAALQGAIRNVVQSMVGGQGATVTPDLTMLSRTIAMGMSQGGPSVEAAGPVGGLAAVAAAVAKTAGKTAAADGAAKAAGTEPATVPGDAAKDGGSGTPGGVNGNVSDGSEDYQTTAQVGSKRSPVTDASGTDAGAKRRAGSGNAAPIPLPVPTTMPSALP
ncbi:unnamed protein product [Pedinophyceae sp. YPF-701]|nr:unnamed protein product [Pedinophyceae sp. YPF-701]